MIIKSEIHLIMIKIHIDMWGKKIKAKTKDNTVNLQNMSVSGPGNCTFLKIYWAGKHQKGAISGPGNLQKGREILYLLFPCILIFLFSLSFNS